MGDSIKLDGELEWGATHVVTGLVGPGQQTLLGGHMWPERLDLRPARSVLGVLLMNSVGSSVTIWRICMTVLYWFPPS